MLNLDTEDWNELYIGCAGGGGWQFRRRYAVEAAADCSWWRLGLKGLAGGHSGIQIHEQLGNAIKLLGQSLATVDGLRLARFDAGVAHNVIPREGCALFACARQEADRLRALLPVLREQWLQYLPVADRELELSLEPAADEPALDVEASRELLDLLAAFPHGVQAWSLAQPGELVDLSINLARVELGAGECMVESSFRFFNEAQSRPLQAGVLALARRFGLAVEPAVGYPGWEPDFDSPLLARAAALHERLFGRRPAVKAIHAGLECGILKGKKPELDILSFGPTIRGAHSPAERLEIATVAPFWRFLTALLAGPITAAA